MPLKVHTLDGVTYDKATVTQQREYLITLRDEALRQNEFYDAIYLSHCIALLAHVISELES